MSTASRARAALRRETSAGRPRQRRRRRQRLHRRDDATQHRIDARHHRARTVARTTLDRRVVLPDQNADISTANASTGNIAPAASSRCDRILIASPARRAACAGARSSLAGGARRSSRVRAISSINWLTRLTNVAGSSSWPPSASTAWSNSTFAQSSKCRTSSLRRVTTGCFALISRMGFDGGAAGLRL